ncbi:DnaB replicative DNA helicase [Cellulophaga phage phi14:2]|uniref:Uncharacterized protein n=1 Tax=Cellulophaga phage phi14:2 TaxID=1327990 RepID=S0A3W0_9CAUD|nr:DnaB replicative DNA helicase [Cellulophaga phage phi14:2]AGO48918.1 hypothetical protein Phi14:2_gp040 [Cellulophaga phage phi14:2]
MSKEQKLTQVICNRLYIDSGTKIRIDPKRMRSVKEPLDQAVVDKIADLKDYLEEFEKCVTFIDSIKHPTGIYKFMEDYANSHGTTYYKDVTFTKDGKEFVHNVFDYYEADDPEEYVIIVVDHASLLTNENDLNQHGSIAKLSSEYFVKLRNRFKYSPVLIQQQASSQESVENMKANRLKPTLDGLAECKLTQRDADVVLGLFSPFRHRIKQYPESNGYDITFFKDNIRFLEVIASREGGGNTVCPLFFDGAVNFFKELPLYDDTNAIEEVKKFIKNNRKK